MIYMSYQTRNTSDSSELVHSKIEYNEIEKNTILSNFSMDRRVSRFSRDLNQTQPIDFLILVHGSSHPAYFGMTDANYQIRTANRVLDNTSKSRSL